MISRKGIPSMQTVLYSCFATVIMVASADALRCYSCNGCTGGVLGEALECNGTFSIGPMCYRQTVDGPTSKLEYAGCIELCVMGPSGISAITWTRCCTSDLCNESSYTTYRQSHLYNFFIMCCSSAILAIVFTFR